MQLVVGKASIVVKKDGISGWEDARRRIAAAVRRH